MNNLIIRLKRAYKAFFQHIVINETCAMKWIKKSEQLPNDSMVVKWLYTDGVEDIGFYSIKHKEFLGCDFRSDKPITHWKPLEDVQPACS